MGVNHWASEMYQRAWEISEVMWPEGPLLDGQHRLLAHLHCEDRMVRSYDRRRRIVRVTTLKYRARKRRR